MRVALCMIIKDEAKIIARCIDSVAPLVDRALFVDTGSTDGTMDVVQAHCAAIGLPCDILSEPWLGFGPNRTSALRHLHRLHPDIDYAAMVDADETLVVPSGLDLEQFKASLAADLYYVKFWRGPSFWYMRPTLYRNSGRVIFKGVTHEFPTGHRSHSNVSAIEGYEFNAEGARAGTGRDKYVRDAELLKDALKTETDPMMVSRYTFYLAQSYRDCGYYSLARDAYLKRATMGFWQEEVYIALLEAARITERLSRRPHEVIAAYLAAYEANPRRMEAIHGAAKYCREHKLWHQGYMFARTAIGLRLPGAESLFVETMIYDYQMLDEFAILAYWTGRFKACATACDTLLNGGRLPEEHVARVMSNRDHASRRLPMAA